jgi:plasmid maintenance system antidote protein VapI
MKKAPKPISDGLKAAVEKHSESQYAIAKAIEMHPSNFNAWMRGDRTIPLETADKLAAYLGVKVQ